VGRRRLPHARAPRLVHARRHRRPRPRPADDDPDPDLSNYTFGDSAVARRRLDLVADVFEAPSAAFLREHVDFRPHFALDLGCGPGRTTRLVAEVTGAELVVGLDTSEPFLNAAPRTPAIAFVRADTTQPFPTRPPDLVYARLLLAHLPEPARVISAWAIQLRPGGLLLLDEVEWIETPNAVLARYEEIVSAMVASRGALISVGPRIVGLSGAGWGQRSTVLRRHPVPTAHAARMYAMNLATWRDDPFVTANYDTETIDDLAEDLEKLTSSATTDGIEWGLRQVVYERT
jgi:trans-aconitate 2-methyltransferase